MLQDFIKANGLSAEVFETKGLVKSSAKAAQELNDNEAVCKSILLMGSDNESFLVILLGKDKIDFKKIKEILGVKDVRLAEPEEVFEITGYIVGGVPPISIYGVKTLIDKAVVQKEEVVCGGGTPNHLMRIKVQEILDTIEDLLVEDVKK